jgi:hypothetical protein
MMWIRLWRTQVLTLKKDTRPYIYSQIVSNLERAWEITGGGEDQLTGM